MTARKPELLDSKCEYAETPNVSSGKREATRLIVLHYTASDNYHSTVQWLMEKRAKASAHFVVGRNGETCQLAPLDAVTWHAGTSVWKGQPSVNAFSVGIEIVNLGPLLRKPDAPYVSVSGSRVVPASQCYHGKHEKDAKCGYEYWQTYPREQVARVAEMIALLKKRYPGIKAVTGHSDVAPGRKIDPGPALPPELYALPV